MTKRASGEDCVRSEEQQEMEPRKAVCYCADSKSDECGTVTVWTEDSAAPHTPRSVYDQIEATRVEKEAAAAEKAAALEAEDAAVEESEAREWQPVCYCSLVHRMDCGYVSQEQNPNGHKHASFKRPEEVAEEERVDCVLFVSINEDAQEESYYVPLDAFSSREKAVLQRLWATAARSLITVCWANRDPENAVVHALGVRLGFDDDLKNALPVTDLRAARVKQPYARVAMVIAGHCYE